MDTPLLEEKRIFAEITSLPKPKWKLPLLGHAWQFKQKHIHLKMEAWADELGPFYQVNLGPDTFLVTTHLESINYALKERPDTFRRGARMRDILGELIGEGVFNAEGSNWKEQRSIVSEALKPEHIRAFMPTLFTFCNQFNHLIKPYTKQNQTFNPLIYFQKFTIDVTSKFAFGFDSLNMEKQAKKPLQSAISLLFPAVSNRLSKPFPYWRYFKLKQDRDLDKAIDFIHQEISTIIKGSLERSNVSHQSAEAATNFLDKLLLLGESHNQAFSTETIIANVITMMLAGEDTTANTLAWLAYYLATYPNIQQKAQAEIEEAKKQGIDLNTLAGIESLSYLDAIIHETLRLRAAAPFLIVEATQDLDLAGIEIPAGQNIILLTRKAALNDEHFAAAKAFRPERWLKPDTENSQITPHQKKAFLPFGNGPRFCPGRYLAMIEIKALFSKVLSEYSFTLPEASEPIQEMFQFTMLPEHLSLHLNARH